MTRPTEQLRRVESVPSLDFRMHYGSIIGMTQYYRPSYAAPSPKKIEPRKTMVSFAKEDDTFYFDPSFPPKSLSCPDFKYNPKEDDELENEKTTVCQLDSIDEESEARLEETPEKTNAQGNECDQDLSESFFSAGARKDVLRDHKENIGTRMVFKNSPKKSGQLQEACVLIERKRDAPKQQQQHNNNTLDRDRDQLKNTKNLVNSKIAMFESLQKNNGNQSSNLSRASFTRPSSRGGIRRMLA